MKNQIKSFAAVVAVLLAASCSPNCEDNKQSYENGYNYGLVAGIGGNISCGQWADSMEKMGKMIDDNDCFCDGFDDGVSGKGNKYKDK